MGGRRLRGVRPARRRGRRAPRRPRRHRARRHRPRRRLRHRQRRHPRGAGGCARHRRRPHPGALPGGAGARRRSRRRGRLGRGRRRGAAVRGRRVRPRAVLVRLHVRAPPRARRGRAGAGAAPAGPAGDLRVHARRRGRRLLPDARRARTAAAGLRGEPARLGRSVPRALAVRRPRPALRAAVLLRALRVPGRRGRALHDDVRAGRVARRPGARRRPARAVRAPRDRRRARRSPTTTSSRCRWRRERVSPTAPGAARPA